MFRGLFNMEKPFWKWVGRIPTMMALSLCWYVCCIPVITIVPACCALFDAVSRGLIRDNETAVFKRFWGSFIRGLKRGIGLTIFWVIIIAPAILGYLVTSNGLGIHAIIYAIMFLILVSYLSWLIVLESRYHSSFLQLHKNALYFYFGKLPSSCLMLLSTIGVMLIAFSNPIAYILLTVAPCLIAVFHTFPVEKAFRAVFPQDYADDSQDSTEEDPEVTASQNKD